MSAALLLAPNGHRISGSNLRGHIQDLDVVQFRNDIELNKSLSGNSYEDYASYSNKLFSKMDLHYKEAN